MRRHSEGWLIKVLFGLIALSFIAFFGYSAATRRQLGAQTAALVGKRIIPIQQYEQAYDAAIRRMQDQFSEGVPENFSRFLRSNILAQMIERKVMTEFAHSLGLRIADQEVAHVIRKEKQFYRDGIFDMSYYQKRFRPSYRQRFGLDFEQALREDLLVDLYKTFVRQGMVVPPQVSNWQKAVSASHWEFQVVTVSDSAVEQAFPDDPEAEIKLQAKLEEWLEAWKKGPLPASELKTFQARLQDKIEVSFLERDKLLDRPLPDEYVGPIFQMKQAALVYPQPIRLGNSWYLVKLLKFGQKEPTELDNTPLHKIHDEFFTFWLDDFREGLDIRSNISF